ncbi:MAG: TM2 domain-containing protein [Myxococcota bacterium]
MKNEKNLTVSYILCATGMFSPLAGLHRFYLGRPISGMLYLMTWGLFGIGTFLDMLQMPLLVQEANAFSSTTRNMGVLMDSWFESQDHQPETNSIDNRILHLAKNSQGTVTVQMVSLETGLSLQQSQQELDRLLKEGFCTVDVSDEGCMLYTFQGLSAQHKSTHTSQRHRF